MTGAALDLDRLLKLRLLVARFGEMDLAKAGESAAERFAERAGDKKLQTEEQLDAALAGLRDACARLIGAGKKAVLS
ncbi:uncharacterized protein SOCE26_015760 [Sorangium cellulosum]|uniref:Uncharacterized protein n=1 Tax=Sorangium cellulosum TaxID=56 RepID=A0A2L0ELL0_SORCE|nr:hypothetical protein [Sorangium cellulosum]AUX40177.1 uncharacterized protein SOCE26_015760 [Sorangium cellulosum]